jgi:hypothetical protein
MMNAKRCTWILVFSLLNASSVVAQLPTDHTTSFDDRPEQLMKQDPSTLVSEATYERKWPYLRESNITWKMRLWRLLDTRTTANTALNDIGTAHGSLISVLIDGAREGRFKAFNPTDDRFTTELSWEALNAKLYNDSVSRGLLSSPKEIRFYRLKEDWLYITSERKLVCRIIGIAPLRERIAPNGSRALEPVCWFYYPVIRPYLVEQTVSRTATCDAQNLDELFEMRKYTGTIERSVAHPRPTPEQQAQVLKIEAMMDQQKRADEHK